MRKANLVPLLLPLIALALAATGLVEKRGLADEAAAGNTLTAEQKSALAAVDVRLAGVETLAAKVNDPAYKAEVARQIQDLKKRRLEIEKNFDPALYETLMHSVISRYQVIALWLKAPALPVPAAAATASSAHQVVFLWPAGAPTLRGAEEKEITDPADPQPGQPIEYLKNVHNPSIEVYLAPADKAVGTAIVVAPGGGHSRLFWRTNGTAMAEWLNEQGVTAFVLKYRLAQTPGYDYSVDKESLGDLQRAIRIVRARAGEWKVDAARVGVLGISAGGELAAYSNLRFDRGEAGAADPIDRQSCRPDFVGLLYPVVERMGSEAPPDAAPTFIACAGIDDKIHAQQSVDFHNLLFRANVLSELHIYAHGKHGGSISPRNGIPFGTWHLRYTDWLADLGMLKPAAAQ